MEKIAIDDVDHPPTISPADVVRPLGPDLGTTAVAINGFELAPGDTFGFDYHRHLDQEEVFYVREGTATFRTESGDVEVGPGELVRFARGELQLGRNDGPDRVVALGFGAPRGSRELEYARPCPTCDEDTVQTLDVDREGGVVRVVCETCGTVEVVESE